MKQIFFFIFSDKEYHLENQRVNVFLFYIILFFFLVIIIIFFKCNNRVAKIFS